MSDRPQRFGPLTGWLVRTFIERGREPLSEEERSPAYGLLEGYISVVVNAALFALKLGLGLLTGSIALVADAVHTLADCVTSVVIIAGSYIARRPPDADHPYGHGRAESVAAVVVAVLLATAGVEFARTSVERILDPQPVQASWLVVGVILSTAAAKEWLARFAGALSRASGNTALQADAWHHRSDVLATVMVAGGMIAGRYGVPVVDGVMGVVISLLLLKVALDVGRRAFDVLLGRAPSLEELAEVKRRALQVEGVLGVHNIMVHHYGPVRFTSLHVEISDDLSAMDVHGMTHRVEEAVAGDRGAAVVHMDPVNLDHPLKTRIEVLIREAAEREPLVESWSDLRMLGSRDQVNVTFNVRSAVPKGDELDGARRRLGEAIREEFPRARVSVELVSTFASRTE